MKQQDPELRRRRADILAEYRFYGLNPMRIGGEPISLELALHLGLLVETPPTPQRQEAS